MKKKPHAGPRFFKPAIKPHKVERRVIDVTIERLSDEGRGIAFNNGKAIFVPTVLPGEVARVRTLEQKRSAVEAELIELIEPAANRIAPRCKLFGRCGGCQLQMLDHADQLAHKQTMLAHLLAPFTKTKGFQWATALTAEPWHYRHRARLAVAAIDGQPAIGFKGNSSHQVISVDACPILDERLQPLLLAIPQWLAQLEQWRRLEEILIAVDADGRLAMAWNAQRAFPKADAEKLQALAQSANIHCAARDDVGAPLVYRSAAVGGEFLYGIRDFTQVNPAINDLLSQCVIDWLQPTADDVIADFFSGLGNFTLPLARRAKAVTGFESSHAMVERATRYAMQLNCLNAQFQLLDLFEGADALVDQFDKVLLDPPRAGAKSTCERLEKFKRLRRIVYVSCNPQTLARDIEILVNGGFDVERAALVDMFPQTGHCESIVLLSRK